jgi:hypothetical protein
MNVSSGESRIEPVNFLSSLRRTPSIRSAGNDHLHNLVTYRTVSVIDWVLPRLTSPVNRNGRNIVHRSEPGSERLRLFPGS